MANFPLNTTTHLSKLDIPIKGYSSYSHTTTISGGGGLLTKLAAYANTPAVPGQVYLSASQLGIKLGMSRTTIWRYLKNDPEFPQPFYFGKTTRRWSLADIETWINSRSN